MVSKHGGYDIELQINGTTERFRLMSDENGFPMYKVETMELDRRDPLTYTYNSWLGGHGQYDRKDVPENDMFFDGKNIDTTIKGSLFLGPKIHLAGENDQTALDSNVLGFAWSDANSEWLCWTTNKIYFLDASNDWDAATTDVSGVTDIVEYNGVMYAARGLNTAYFTSTDDDTWVTTDLADDKAHYFVVAPNPAGTQDVLWKAMWPNEITNTTNGVAGGTAWASPTYIGDTTTNITNIFLHNDLLMVGKTDGLWQIDANGGIHQLRGDLKVNRSTNNFKYTARWSSATYHSESDGMGEIYSTNTYEPMGPLWKVGQDVIGDIGKSGTVVGIASGGDYLYVMVDEGTDTHIYKGKEVVRDGVRRWEWCPWVSLEEASSAAMEICQHSSTDKRLWFAHGDASIDVGTTVASKGGSIGGNFTRLLLDNPANKDGNLLLVSGWFETTTGDAVNVGTFYNVSGTTYKCRDAVSFVVSTTGSNTFLANLEVRTGDLIGWYSSTGTAISFSDTGGSGHYYNPATGNVATRGTTTAFLLTASADDALYGSSGIGTGYVILTDNPLADSNAQFAADGYARMSYDYGSNPNYDKLWQSAVLEQHRNASGAVTISGSGETVEVRYRDDTDTSSTQLISAFNTGGLTETVFGSAINDNRIQYELHLASDTSSATPVVTYFQAKGIEKPTVVRTHEMVLKAYDGKTNQAKTLRNLLRDSGSSTSLVRFADIGFGQKVSGTAGTDYYNCVVEPGYPLEQRILTNRNGTTEMGVKLVLREVNFS